MTTDNLLNLDNDWEQTSDLPSHFTREQSANHVLPDQMPFQLPNQQLQSARENKLIIMAYGRMSEF